MPKETWIIAAVLTTLLVLGVVGFSSCAKQRELEQIKSQITEAQAGLSKNETEIAELKERLAQSQARADELQKEKESAVQTHKTLEDEMRAALESKDVTISKLQGKLTVNIVDRILFDSGEADLKPGGAVVLRKVADILAQHPELKIHVIGHTDNVPIKAGARSRFPSNWELSTARATAAVRFLTEAAGVDPRRLGVVGYGEFRPIADNATSEGRARNRRIAITILSEELAGVDSASPSVALPIPQPVAEITNAPSVGTNSPVREEEMDPSR